MIAMNAQPQNKLNLYAHLQLKIGQLYTEKYIKTLKQQLEALHGSKLYIAKNQQQIIIGCYNGLRKQNIKNMRISDTAFTVDQVHSHRNASKKMIWKARYYALKYRMEDKEKQKKDKENNTHNSLTNIQSQCKQRCPMSERTCKYFVAFVSKHQQTQKSDKFIRKLIAMNTMHDRKCWDKNQAEYFQKRTAMNMLIGSMESFIRNRQKNGQQKLSFKQYQKIFAQNIIQQQNFFNTNNQRVHQHFQKVLALIYKKLNVLEKLWNLNTRGYWLTQFTKIIKQQQKKQQRIKQGIKQNRERIKRQIQLQKQLCRNTLCIIQQQEQISIQIQNSNNIDQQVPISQQIINHSIQNCKNIQVQGTVHSISFIPQQNNNNNKNNININADKMKDLTLNQPPPYNYNNNNSKLLTQTLQNENNDNDRMDQQCSIIQQQCQQVHCQREMLDQSQQHLLNKNNKNKNNNILVQIRKDKYKENQKIQEQKQQQQQKMDVQQQVQVQVKIYKGMDEQQKKQDGIQKQDQQDKNSSEQQEKCNQSMKDEKDQNKQVTNVSIQYQSSKQIIYPNHNKIEHNTYSIHSMDQCFWDNLLHRSQAQGKNTNSLDNISNIQKDMEYQANRQNIRSRQRQRQRQRQNITSLQYIDCQRKQIHGDGDGERLQVSKSMKDNRCRLKKKSQRERQRQSIQQITNQRCLGLDLAGHQKIMKKKHIKKIS